MIMITHLPRHRTAILPADTRDRRGTTLAERAPIPTIYTHLENESAPFGGSDSQRSRPRDSSLRPQWRRLFAGRDCCVSARYVRAQARSLGTMRSLRSSNRLGMTMSRSHAAGGPVGAPSQRVPAHGYAGAQFASRLRCRSAPTANIRQIGFVPSRGDRLAGVDG